MCSKASIIICLQMLTLVENWSQSEICKPDQSQKPHQCGERMCQCTNNVAFCEGTGQYTLDYIPKLPDEITKLYFHNHHLPNITRETFQNVSTSSINVLSIINNAIKNISEDAFSGFNKLQKLCLNQNEVVDKTQLSMSLRRIPAPYTFTLCLATMNWNEVSDGLFMNPLASKVGKLDLSENRMKAINWTAFQNLTALTYLNLSGNKIREMTQEVGHPTLMSLNMDGNKIVRDVLTFCSASYGIPLFPRLTNLSMSNNFISNLKHDSLQCLGQLRFLGLSGNNIRKLKNNVFSSLNNLFGLKLANMGRSSSYIEPYALNNSNLEYLDLRSNKLFLKKTDSQSNIFQLSTSLRELDISNNNLKKLSNGQIMHLLRPMKKLDTLKAMKINLRSIPNGLLDVFNNLTVLNLEGNQLSNVQGLCNSVKKVKRLSLIGNKIRVLDKRSISEDFLSSVKELKLGQNPFSCTCENQWFRSMINDKGMIRNVSLKNWPKNYYCAFPLDLKGTFFRDYHPTESSCNRKNYILIVRISLAAVLIVSSVAVVLGYKYRWYVTYCLYKHKSNRRTAEEEPLLERNVDAFMIYNPSDSQYVHHDIRLLLEEEHAYKLHIWERDVTAGSDNIRGMVSGMDASRRAIAIISKDSLDDGWFQFQLSVALDRQIELKTKYLILVILENVECEGLSKYWCVLLTRLPTARWCHDKTDVKRAACEQQLFNHLGCRNIN